MSSPDGCPGYLNDGTYAISTSSLWVGTESVGDVINVVVDKPETVGSSTLLTDLMTK